MTREELFAELAKLRAEVDRLSAAARSEAGETAEVRHGSDWSEARELIVEGIEQPAALVRTKGQSVELTLISERRAGFLNYVAENGEQVIYAMMRAFEGEDDVREMIGHDVSDDTQ